MTNDLVTELGLDQAIEAQGITRASQSIRREREAIQASSEAVPHTLYGHEHPRLHDLLCIYMHENLGSRKGVVISRMQLVFRRSVAPNHQTVEEMVRAREILVCVGRGPFSKVPQVTNELSVTKNTARFYGVLNDPQWRSLIEWSHEVEAKGAGSFRETAGMIRLLSLANLDDSPGVYTIVQRMMDARRADIIEELRAEADLKAGLRTMKVSHNGRDLIVGGVRSDAPMIARVSRREPFNVDVLIRISSTGHALITAKHGISLEKAAAYIRKKEAEIAGEPQPDNPTAPREVGRWIYKPERMESLINGGFTAPDMPPTAIGIEELTTLMVWGLEGV